MRQTLVVRAVNGVSGEAGAGTANLIYRHGRISGCSGILFEKKIKRNTRAGGNAQVGLSKRFFDHRIQTDVKINLKGLPISFAIGINL